MKFNNTIKKLLLVKESIISHFFSIFLKNLQPKTYNSFEPEGSQSLNGLKPSIHNLKSSRGFTLVELLVTLSLFVALTTIVLFSNSQFNGSILLTNLAYDVALTVRQAQTYGVNVREVSTDVFDKAYGVNVREVSTDVFDKAYGVHFDTKSTAKFILFADTNGDGKYTDTDTKIDTYKIKRGNKIKGISCISRDSSCNGITTLDITFLRPNPDAKINNNDNITSATITVTSADGGSTRNIVINSTGQISVTR